MDGAVQAQDLRSALWALGLRTKRPSISEVTNALRSGRIIRVHIMRPTWHFVLPEDLRWMAALNRDKLEQAYKGYNREFGLDIGEDDYARSTELLCEALQGGRELTSNELALEMEKGGLPSTHHHMRAYLWRAETRAIVCGGMPRNGMMTYALIDERVPPTPVLSRDEAIARLFAKYLRSHAPATLEDFIWWSSLSRTDAQRAIDSRGKDVERAVVGGRTFYIHCDSRRRGRLAGMVSLLPPYDEYLLGYKDRTDVLPAAWAHRAHNNRGIFQRILLQGGQVTGNWSERAAAKGAQISVDLWRKDVDTDSVAMERTITRYLHFLQAKA